MRLIALLCLSSVLAAAGAEGKLFTAPPDGKDTCANGRPLGLEEIRGLAIAGYDRLLLLKCDCECTVNENDLQLIGIRNGQPVPIAGYEGYGLRIVKNPSDKNAVFSIVQNVTTGISSDMDEDTVRLAGLALKGANGDPHPKQLAPASLIISKAGNTAAATEPAVSLDSLWKAASALYKAGKKSEAADFIAAKFEAWPYPFANNRVGIFNDLAYYLEEGGKYAKAAELLKNILSHVQGRTVAYLNLGDAYVGLGRKDSAEAMYSAYARKMDSAGLGKKVPARIRGQLQGK